jgi:hypothetical protein
MYLNGGTTGQIICDMSADCRAEATHIDESGFVYCPKDAERRKDSGRRARKLRPHEVNRLRRGEPLDRY